MKKLDFKSAGELLEAAPDAMIAVGRDGTMSCVNGQAEILFGYPRSELLGHPLERLIPERFRSDHRGYMSALFATPERGLAGAGFGLLARHQDGTEFPIEVRLSPIAINDEEFVMAAVRDVTDRKRLEANLET